MSDSSLCLEAKKIACIRSDRVLFKNLSFCLQAGELVQLEGENGSGKTSLLRILCGLGWAEAGEVLWGGEPLRALGDEYLEQVLYIGHSNGVKGELSPLENLTMACALSHGPTASTAEYQASLQQVGLQGFASTPSGKLSAGQRRRVALARLLHSKAPLWLLDEPFTALDRKGTQMMEAILAQHIAQAGMVVLTTHHPLGIASLHPRLVHLG